MLVPLEISTRLIDLTPALEADLRRRADKLEKRFDRINSCRIAVERPSLHHREGGPYRVRLDITVPGHELVVDKEAEDLSSAVRDAFQAAERQVEEFHDRLRREVKTLEHPPQGRVVRLFEDEGYGFIQGADGQEVYFHRNSVLEPGFGQLKVGSSVRYAEEQGYEGPQASTVTPLSA